MNSTIALLTDFGIYDNYVGVMKGVIKKIATQAEFIDITHDIEVQNVKHGAFVLKNSYKFFPDGTIFLAIVDPEVGNNRKAICIQTDNFFFLAPDNGILSYALRFQKIKQIISLDNQKYFLPFISNTFHGRDIFAPIAGHICNGTDISYLGTQLDIDNIIKLPNLHLQKNDTQLIGEIIYSDRFGNLVTSINYSDIQNHKIKSIHIGEIIISHISITYADVNRGEFIAYFGSSGYLEIGIRNGSAKKTIKIFDQIKLDIT